jgi:hypothetical protein
VPSDGSLNETDLHETVVKAPQQQQQRNLASQFLLKFQILQENPAAKD